MTALVASATLFALAQPEGIGGRDSAVRLTRGVQRLRCAETTAADHTDTDARVGAPAEIDTAPVHLDGAPAPAVLAAAVTLAPPTWHPLRVSGRLPTADLMRQPGHDIPGRAPPAL